VANSYSKRQDNKQIEKEIRVMGKNTGKVSTATLEIKGEARQAVKEGRQALQDGNTAQQALYRIEQYLIYKDKSVVAWSNTIKANWEDCKQELTTIALEEYDKLFSTNPARLGKLYRDGKLTVSRKNPTYNADDDESAEYIKIEIYSETELLFGDYFILLYRSIKNRFISYLDRSYASISYKYQLDINNRYTNIDGETVKIGEYSEETTEDEILNRIEDKASKMSITAVELLKDIQGSLTVSQYNYLEKYVELGKAPYDSSKMKKSLKNGLKDYTPNEIATALSYKLYAMNI
jgi:hypothetical protein